jgi:hypothetical protein
MKGRSHRTSTSAVADVLVAQTRCQEELEEEPLARRTPECPPACVTDLDPPKVEVSLDGTMAWLFGHVRLRGTQRKAKGVEVPLAFDAAWIDVWQKKTADGESWPERTLRRTMLHAAEESALKVDTVVHQFKRENLRQ